MADQKKWKTLRCQACGKPISYRQRRSRICDSCRWEWKRLRNYASRKTKFLISIGKVRPKPINCEECYKKDFLQLHHLDYMYPEKILWLCPKCHTKWHEKYGGANG